jgi:hypothetical protein
VKRLKGKPFVFLGVNSDPDRGLTREKMEREGMTWRSWWDGGGTTGPIATKWDVQGWPTVYVLDLAGVIRHKGVRGEALDRAVDELLWGQ